MKIIEQDKGKREISGSLGDQMFKLGLEKVEEPEIKLPTFAGSQRKLEFLIIKVSFSEPPRINLCLIHFPFPHTSEPKRKKGTEKGWED